MTMQTTKYPQRGSTLDLSVSTTSARSGPFIRSDVGFYCASACYVKFGDSTVVAVASDYDIYVPAGTRVDLNTDGKTYAAVLLLSGTDTAYINEWK